MARPADPAVRAALIEAAAARVVAGGADAVSVRGVAADVGASTQAVYTYFGSKDDLLRAVVVEAFARLDTRLREVPRTVEPIADLLAVGLAYRANALANANLYRVMFDRNPLALSSPVDHATTDDDLDIGLDAFLALVDAVRRCTDAGHLVGDPGAIAVQVWAVAHGTVSLELAGFLDADGETVFAAAGRNLIAGLRPPT
jgi:AcrR family transcriptional regulator